jgi:hypothetical protein
VKIKSLVSKMFILLSLCFMIAGLYLSPYLKQNLNSTKIDAEVKREMLSSLGLHKKGEKIVDALPVKDIETIQGIGEASNRVIQPFFRLGKVNVITHEMIAVLMGLNALSLLFLSLAYKFYYADYICIKCDKCKEKKLMQELKEQIIATLSETQKITDTTLSGMDEILQHNKDIGIVNLESMNYIAEGMSSLRVAINKIDKIVNILN